MQDNIKICTVTHHTVPNYGAVLQAYALQTTINNLGYNTEILDYRTERVKRVYHQSLFAQKSIKEAIRHIVYFNRFRRRNKPFYEFVKNYLVCSKQYNNNSIHKADGFYDLYVTGSDQVWNLALHEGNTSYMLDFVKDDTRKGAYAASFGYSEVPEKYIEKTRKYISRFKYINLREESGKYIIDKLGIKQDNNVVLDPTLLLTRDTWKALTHDVDWNNYILVYEICNIDNSYTYARELAKKTGKKILAIQPFNDIHKRCDSQIEYIFGASPQMFLSLILNADYVITSSFHGTVFSILFHKQFVCSVKEEGKTNSRILELIDMFGLGDRIVGKCDYHNEINYFPVDAVLKDKQSESLEILKSMITDRIDVINDKEK